MASAPLRWVEPTRRVAPAPVAAQLLRQALATSPDSIPVRRDLGRLLYECADWRGAIEFLAPAVDAGDAVATHLSGLSSFAGGDLDAAVRDLRRAGELGAPGASSDLVEAVARRDGDETAACLALAALDDDPHDTQALAVEARRLLGAGRAGELDALCTSLTARGACNAQLHSSWASAKAALGEVAAAAALVDHRLVSVARLAVGTDDFNRRVRDEIIGHPNRVAPNPRRATVGGERVDALLTPSTPHLAMLADAIRQAIDGYVAALPDVRVVARGHDASRSMSDLRMWAVVLRGDDHESLHLHPSASVSGVYYVAVPEGVDGAGALELGIIGAEMPRRRVVPEPGMVVLFPASFAHCTIPTGSTEPRISVAFDVVAA